MGQDKVLRKIFINEDNEKYFTQFYAKDIDKNTENKSSIVIKHLETQICCVLPLDEFYKNFQEVK